jgi:hypothetical protein
MRRLLVIAALAGCGGTPASTPAPEPAQIALAAPAGGSDDVVVASVNGRPVWASCVAAQGRAKPGDSDAQGKDLALHECIDFELLAQAAEARGLARDPDVASAHRTELVSRLIARDFEAVYRTPADFKGVFDHQIEQNASRQHEPEFRASAYVRVVIPDHPPAAVDAEAHAIADQIAAAVADQTGLFGANLFELGETFAKRTKLPLAHADVPFKAITGLQPAYGNALFEIPAIGRSAGPIRTTIPAYPDQGGWDVLVWTDVVPAAELTPDQLVAAMFPDLLRSFFARWVDQIVRSLGIHVERDLAQLDEGA